MAWWSNHALKEVKRKNRFLVKMGSGGTLLTLKSTTKPKATISKKEYKLVNHYFSYPGVVKWEPITMVFVDVGFWGASGTTNHKDAGNIPAPDKRGAAEQFWEMLLASGYSIPGSTSNVVRSLRNKSITSPEKASTMDVSFGKYIYIEQIDSNGKTIEKWELKNPIITSLSWGELDYGDDALVEYTLELSYDWAVWEGAKNEEPPNVNITPPTE